MGKLIDLVKEMNKGEECRDAAPNIRGFVFQDLLAVELLVAQEYEVADLYVEWVEDMYLEEADHITIIQAKYYASEKSTVDFKEIYNELFYQHLRLKALKCEKKTSYRLSYFNPEGSKHKHTFEQMKQKLIKVCGACYNQDDFDKNWLDNTVYKKIDGKARNKESREKIVISCMGIENELRVFYDNFTNDLRDSALADYRKELKKKIIEMLKRKSLFPVIGDWDEDTLATVFLAEATAYIREAYDENNKDAPQRKRTTTELLTRFDKLIQHGLCENNIYLLVKQYMNEVFEDNILLSDSLISENSESEYSIKLYAELSKTTIEYLEQLLKTIAGQQCLFNTVSCEKNAESYSEMVIRRRMDMWKQNKEKLQCFIRNIWKILFDIDCREFTKYLSSECKEYLQFHFPKIENQKTVVLSEISLSEEKSNVKNVFRRYRALEGDMRPNRWLLRTSSVRGVGNYETDISRIVGEFTTNISYMSILGGNFILECMECIRLDENYGEKDDCEKCIFASQCVKES